MMDGRNSVSEITQAIRDGQVSAVEVTQACLQDIRLLDTRYNSFTEITAIRALEEANKIDELRKLGMPLPPLAGVPYAVKNLFDIVGVSTLAGSKINQANPPASQDAVLIKRMQQAGAILLGALNMDEYAYGFTTENHHYGPSRNPHAPTRSAGGSSGGSAAAVAAGFVPVTLGSDTNGSVRVPASLCGLFGLKPTYGALTLDGMFPFVHSFDHAGIFARHSADLERVFSILRPSPSKRKETPARDSLRLAQLGGYFSQGDRQAQQAVEQVSQALAVKHTLELPEVAIARAAAYVITASEGGNRHLSRLQSQAENFDPLTRPRLAAGALVPAAWYIQAQRFRHWFHEQVMQLFNQYDILIAPATPCCAQPLGQETIDIQGQSMLLRPNMGMFTQPISFLGLPVIAVPVQSAGQMPIAVQLIAPPWREDWLFKIAARLEQIGVCLAPVTRQ